MKAERGEKPGDKPSLHEKIIACIRRIPRGRVATYGQIARLAGSPRAARQVAWALSSSSYSRGLPWQRVVNREGRIALPRGGPYERQVRLLKKEGVSLDENERIDLAKYGWKPRALRNG